MDQKTISKAFEYCLKAFLVIGTMFYIPFKGPGDPVSQGYMVQELFFRYGVMTLFFVSMALRPIRSMSLSHLAVFGIFAVASSVGYGMDVSLRHKLLNVFFGLLFFKLCFENTRLSELPKFAWWFGWLLVANLAIVALQQNALDPVMSKVGTIHEDISNMTVGFMRAKVHLGVLAALLAPMVVFFAPCFALAVLPLLWYGQSSAAVASCVLCLGLWAFLNIPRRWFVVLSVLGLLAGGAFVMFYDMPGGQFAERFKVWHAATSIGLKTNPWVGNGIGSFARFNFQTLQPGSENLSWTWCHNEFIQSFFEFGIIGIGIIVSFLISQAKKFKEHFSDPTAQILGLSVLTCICISFIHFPFHLARFAPICIFFFALHSARLEDHAA
jgi:hypothetical protein